MKKSGMKETKILNAIFSISSSNKNVFSKPKYTYSNYVKSLLRLRKVI